MCARANKYTYSTKSMLHMFEHVSNRLWVINEKSNSGNYVAYSQFRALGVWKEDPKHFGLHSHLVEHFSVSLLFTMGSIICQSIQLLPSFICSHRHDCSLGLVWFWRNTPVRFCVLRWTINNKRTATLTLQFGCQWSRRGRTGGKSQA